MAALLTALVLPTCWGTPSRVGTALVFCPGDDATGIMMSVTHGTDYVVATVQRHSTKLSGG